METVTHERSSRSEDDRLARVFEQLLALQATEPQATLAEAGRVVASALDADAVHVLLRDESGGALVEVHQPAATPPPAEGPALARDRLPRALSDPAARVFASGKPIVAGQAGRDLTGLPGHVRSLLCVPLATPAGRRGVLLLVSSRPGLFGASDAPLVERLARWVGLALERTERASQAARAASEQAQAAAAERLIRGLAHDIGNVITPLKARIDMIERRARREERQRDRDDAIAAGQALGRLRGMVDNMIDAARLEQGLFSISPQSVNLAELVRETVAGIGAPEETIEIAAPPELLTWVDPVRLRQALEHLLANALKHGGAGGPIQLSLDQERHDGDDWVCLEVADHGPGVDAALLPRIFDLFVAGPSSNGLGLGLSLARGIAQAHGGNLTTRPTPGGGATFTLALPKRTEAARDASPPGA